MTKRDLIFKLRRTTQLGKWHVSMRLRQLEDSYYGQLHLLGYIVEHPGCTQKDMAEHFTISKAAVTKTVTRMIANGLVSRKVNENDERKYEIYLTEKGQEINKQCFEIFESVENLVFAGLSEKELKELDRILNKIDDNLETNYSRNKSIKQLYDEMEKGRKQQ